MARVSADANNALLSLFRPFALSLFRFFTLSLFRSFSFSRSFSRSLCWVWFSRHFRSLLSLSATCPLLVRSLSAPYPLFWLELCPATPRTRTVPSYCDRKGTVGDEWRRSQRQQCRLSTSELHVDTANGHRPARSISAMDAHVLRRVHGDTGVRAATRESGGGGRGLCVRSGAASRRACARAAPRKRAC